MVQDEWLAVVLRLKSEVEKTLANNADGVAIVGIHIVADAAGKPLFWVVSDGQRVEPSKNAKQLLIAALSS